LHQHKISGWPGILASFADVVWSLHGIKST
jgi:hypothetical protein